LKGNLAIERHEVQAAMQSGWTKDRRAGFLGIAAMCIEVRQLVRGWL